MRRECVSSTWIGNSNYVATARTSSSVKQQCITFRGGPSSTQPHISPTQLCLYVCSSTTRRDRSSTIPLASCVSSVKNYLFAFVRSFVQQLHWLTDVGCGWQRLSPTHFLVFVSLTLHFHRYTFLLTNPRTLFFSDMLVPIISNKKNYDSSCLMVGWSVCSFIRSTAPLAAKRPTGGR